MKKITFLMMLLFAVTITAQEQNFTIKNIQVNSNFQDFGVTYFGENSAIFASSRKDKTLRNRVWVINNQPFLELFKGTVLETGEIIDVKPFSKTLNSKYHESNVAFTKDLKTVYFSRDNYINKRVKKSEDGVVLIQLYKAEIGDDGEWTNIQPLPFNSDDYDTGHPTLNQDETMLYFTSNMPGSFGLTDIWAVNINTDGTYGNPINLGPNVNTNKREMFPYINDENTLYFSSDGYLDGKGGLDIYSTKIINNKAIGTPANLGFPINSIKDDFGLVFQKGKKTGHFSSNRSGGKGDDDIYYFEELKGVKKDCNQYVEGVVREKISGALLPGALVVLFDNNGDKIESIIADKYASFSFKVGCEMTLKVIGTKENYEQDSKEFTTSDSPDLELTLDLNLSPIEFITVRGKLMVNIKPIYFDLDKSEIRTDAAIELEKVVNVMNKYPRLKIDLGSHTDSRAFDSYNMQLSERRAQSSINWIINKGIDPERITGKGYGETKLVNNCANNVKCSEADHQLNRRTEFVIINPEDIK